MSLPLQELSVNSLDASIEVPIISFKEFQKTSLKNVKQSELTIESSRGDHKSDGKTHFCLYYKNLKQKIGRHLLMVHKDQPEIKIALRYQKKSKARKEMLDMVRIRGDYLHNTDARYNTGILILPRRPNSAYERKPCNFIPCYNCGLFLAKSTAYIHIGGCVQDEFRRGSKKQFHVLGKALAPDIHECASNVLKNNLLRPLSRWPISL